MKYKLKTFFIIIFFLPVISFLPRLNLSVQSADCLRVAVVQDVSSLKLSVVGLYEIIDSSSRKVISKGKNLITTVTVYKSGIFIAGIKSNSGRLFIKTNDPEAAAINGRRFRGDIQLIKKSSSLLLAVNQIDLEDYVKGILYHEASHYWPAEALKAQAVVCRTYALYQKGENSSRDYDVTSDIYSQVYGGRDAERYRTNSIVEETKGEVLTYKGRIFPSYYHATCAGHTEDASLLWNIDLLPLKGVACNFCRESPHFNWHWVLSQKEIISSLSRSGYTGFKRVKNIVIKGKDLSGRIGELKIITDTKEPVISAKDFRNIIGPNIIKSTNFSVELAGDDIIFEGIGWGHGVGMCQWGAYFMAKEGYDYKEILGYYYPGSSIE